MVCKIGSKFLLKEQFHHDVLLIFTLVAQITVSSHHAYSGPHCYSGQLSTSLSKGVFFIFLQLSQETAGKYKYYSRKKFSPLWQTYIHITFGLQLIEYIVFVFGKGSILVILQNQETCIMQLFVVVLNIVFSVPKVIFLQAAVFVGEVVIFHRNRLRRKW